MTDKSLEYLKEVFAKGFTGETEPTNLFGINDYGKLKEIEGEAYKNLENEYGLLSPPLTYAWSEKYEKARLKWASISSVIFFFEFENYDSLVYQELMTAVLLDPNQDRRLKLVMSIKRYLQTVGCLAQLEGKNRYGAKGREELRICEHLRSLHGISPPIEYPESSYQLILGLHPYSGKNVVSPLPLADVLPSSFSSQ